jgi:pyruvate/2-oxoglutarate dehydrogenase complex dihydrolipoamide dehydrogenase (E3) component
MSPDFDACVVGAGPAGLAAATRLAENRLNVVVLDEQPRPGGQYFRQVASAVAAEVGEHRPAGRALVVRAVAAGVRMRSSTTVWGVADDGRTLLTWHPEYGIDLIAAPHIIVATGATERALPFPGWTSPRVTTVGYAQHLATEGVPVGSRVLVAGSGPFLLSVACSLIDCGAQVAAVLEAGTPYRPDRAAATMLKYPARLAEFVGYRSRLARARVPIQSGRRIVSAVETAAGLAVVHGGRSGYETCDVDVLCIGYGFRAQVDLLRLLAAATTIDPASGDEVVVTSPDGATDADGVWAAGEVSGIAGAACAEAEGAIVAAGILARHGIVLDVDAERATVARARAFATAMGARYPAARTLATRAAAQLSDDDIVCRCESITAGAIRSATDHSGNDLDAAKAATRAGMGPCQGRECGPALAALCGAASTTFTPRSPIRPIPLDAIAAGAPS